MRIEETRRQRQRVNNLLTAAYLRTTLKMPRTNDVHILMSLGPYVSGEWSPWVERELRRRQRSYYWVECLSKWRCFCCAQPEHTYVQQRLGSQLPPLLPPTPGEAAAQLGGRGEHRMGETSSADRAAEAP